MENKENNLTVPGIIKDDDVSTIQKLFCNLAVGQDMGDMEYLKYCEDILCDNCMFDKNNSTEFIAWFAQERIKGNLSLT